MSKLDELIQKLCPNGVEYKSLLEMFEDIKGMGGVSNKWAEEGNCRFIDYMNAYKNMSIDVEDLPFATVKNLNQDTLKKGDILFTSASEVPNECAIAAAIEKDITEGIFLDDHLFGLRLKEEYSNKFNTGFLKHYFRCEAYRKQVLKAVRGVTRFYISKPDFMKIRIPVPPTEVQCEIVHILDQFTLLTAELTAELTARKQQYEYYRDEVLKFNNKYQLVKINDVILSLNTGLNPRQFFKLNTDDATNYYVTIKEIRGGTLRFLESTDLINDEALKLCNRRSNLEVGDLLYSGTGTIGEMFVIEEAPTNWNIKEGVYSLKPNPRKILSRYLKYILSETKVKSNILSKCDGGTVKSIKMADLKDIIIPLPPLEEQQKIVDILDKFDNYCNDLTQGLPAEIELRKQQYEYYRDKLLTFKELK